MLLLHAGGRRRTRPRETPHGASPNTSPHLHDEDHDAVHPIDNELQADEHASDERHNKHCSWPRHPRDRQQKDHERDCGREHAKRWYPRRDAEKEVFAVDIEGHFLKFGWGDITVSQ